MSATTDRVGRLVTPVLERMGLDLYDIDQPGGTLRVMVDGRDGVDVDQLAQVTRELSALLDEHDPVAGSYTLEVSSPGLERPLRRPEHFSSALGRRVKVKLFPGGEGDRRLDGTLSGVDGDTVTLDTTDGERRVTISQIAKAHTVFEWDGGADAGAVAPQTAGNAQSAGNTTESTTESKEDNR